MNKMKIKIIGIDTSASKIDSEKEKIIFSSEVLAGGKRYLDLFPDFDGIKLTITGDIPGLIKDIKQHMDAGRSISVLASGDPLLFGIANTLIAEFGVKNVEVYPGISAVQTALSRLGLKSDNVLVINRHSSHDAPIDKIFYHSISVILTSEKETPSDIIREILEYFPCSPAWQGHICENLGMEKERIISGNLYELSQIKTYNAPHLLVLVNPYPYSYPQRPILGRPDEEFEHDAGMITHPEIRAITLSKLMLNRHGVMWDIGAGSGSVGIEAALLAPLLKVYCIEKNKARMEGILINKEKFNVQNLFTMHGKATEICPSLPMPDRIFFGGGGDDLYALLSFGFNALKKDGIMVINTVTLESFEHARRFCASEAKEFELIQLQVSRQHAFSEYHMLKSDNPVSIFTVKK
ncbi:MAG: precorrin-6y C5,15-methyltransferase (decarboxylating) subunit CbiE [Deltaproteobacteria bacterium]|nr:precorrin-6y C5,15-methyltransferase (decarboxylating) subunit CbiE [Deltaproteobacteria bacterium]